VQNFIKCKKESILQLTSKADKLETWNNFSKVKSSTSKQIRQFEFPTLEVDPRGLLPHYFMDVCKGKIQTEPNALPEVTGISNSSSNGNFFQYLFDFFRSSLNSVA
jgi:hypothetical protein